MENDPKILATAEQIVDMASSKIIDWGQQEGEDHFDGMIRTAQAVREGIDALIEGLKSDREREA